MKSSSHRQTKQIQSKLSLIDSFNFRHLIQGVFFEFKISRRRDLVNDIFHFCSIIQSGLYINVNGLFNSAVELTKICLKFPPVRECNRKMTEFYGVETIARTLYFAFYLNSENDGSYNINERF